MPAILITGANKGIGYEIAKKFKKNDYPADIIVCSRSEENGNSAIQKLNSECQILDTSPFVFCQLDIADKNSRTDAINFVKEKYGQLDILINNAGFAFKSGAKEGFADQARVSMEINYDGTRDFTVEAIEAGIVKKGGKVLTCASFTSDMNFGRLQSEEEKKVWKNSKDLSLDQLNAMAAEFVDMAKNFTGGEDDKPKKYTKWSYATSKMFVRAFVEICQKVYPDYLHASYCPGWCRTDMAGDKAPRSSEQGAGIAYWLGTSGDASIKANAGKMFKNDDKVFDWGEGPTL